MFVYLSQMKILVILVFAYFILAGHIESGRCQRTKQGKERRKNRKDKNQSSPLLAKSK